MPGVVTPSPLLSLFTDGLYQQDTQRERCVGVVRDHIGRLALDGADDRQLHYFVDLSINPDQCAGKTSKGPVQRHRMTACLCPLLTVIIILPNFIELIQPDFLQIALVLTQAACHDNDVHCVHGVHCPTKCCTSQHNTLRLQLLLPLLPSQGIFCLTSHLSQSHDLPLGYC